MERNHSRSFIKEATHESTSTVYRFSKYLSLFKGHLVLDSLSIQIPEGEHNRILGRTDQEKSSFVKTLLREHYPVYSESGTVFKTWGQERWDVFSLRSQFGYVSQDLQHTFTRSISGMDVVLSGFFSSIGLFFHTITPDMKKKAEDICTFLEYTSCRELIFRHVIR